MRFREKTQGLQQSLPALYVNHEGQEGLIYVLDFRAFLQSPDLMAQSTTDSLVLSLGANCLFHIVHQGGKELVGILLHHRPHKFPIYFHSFHILIRVDWRTNSTVKVSEDLLELQQLDGPFRRLIFILEQNGWERSMVELLDE